MSRLEKKNREDRVASMTLGAFVSNGGVLDICGVPIKNVRFTDKGCSIDLDDGGTIAIRITAYGQDAH